MNIRESVGSFGAGFVFCHLDSTLISRPQLPTVQQDGKRYLQPSHVQRISWGQIVE